MNNSSEARILAELERQSERLVRIESRLVQLMLRSGLFTKREAKGSLTESAEEPSLEWAVEALERVKARMEQK